MQELLADISRLEGGRFDEALFELIRRGPKALDRLFAHIESEPQLSEKAQESIRRQWTRIQEALVELPPRAFSSPGVRALLECGRCEAIARRATKCIEQGMIETAACLAAALASSGQASLDRAILEARLSLVAGRPGEAIALLDPYYQPGYAGAAVAEWLAAAAFDAGDARRAFLTMLPFELDVLRASSMLSAMINAWSVDDLGACILEVARRGNLPGWELLASAAAEAWKATVQEDADTVLELAGARAELEGFFDAIESVLSDVESSPNDAVSASVRGELESLVARATQLVHDIAGKYRLHQGLPGKGETDSVCGGSVELEGPLPDERSWVELLASARESLALDGPWKTSKSPFSGSLPEEVRRAVVLAHAEGRPISTRWAEGEFRIEVGSPVLGGSVQNDDGRILDSVWIEQILKSGPPRKAAEEAIVIIRSRERRHARALLDSTKQMLEAIAVGLSGILEQPPGAAGDCVREMREHVGNLNNEVEDCVAEALGETGAKKQSSPAETLPEWYLSEASGCTEETNRALAAARYLVGSAGPDPVPADQAALVPFLLRKAVQTEAESRLGDVLADYRLRPAVLRATEERGKRRRRISAQFGEEALGLMPEGIPRERILGGLDRLATRVLEGSPKPLAGEMLLMGMAFICFDPLDNPHRSQVVGRALVKLDAALLDAERDAESCDWDELERSAHMTIGLICSAGDEG